MSDPKYVEDAGRLRRLLGEPSERSKAKVRPRLDSLDHAWIRATRFCVLATCDAVGRCDASPKGDPAGFLLQALDDETVVLGERPGNRRADGYFNILDNPHVGILAVVPGRSDVLRINGRARLVERADWFPRLGVDGKLPIVALEVSIEEVFGHCARALIRSGMWHPESWDRSGLRELTATARERRSRGLLDLDVRLSVAELEAAQLSTYDGGLY